MINVIDSSLNNKHFLHAYTLADMNELILDMIKAEGKNVDIKIGSEIKRTRELTFLNTLIEFPQNQSIATRSRWTSEEAMKPYINEVITNIIPDGFTYTYGSLMISPVLFPNQVERVIEILKKDRNNRQATIMLGDGSCLWDKEPPCCRIVDFKVRNGMLDEYLLFRSHDITAYYPNIRGFAELQRIVAGRIGIQPGKIGCTSESMHLYEGDCDLIGWDNFGAKN